MTLRVTGTASLEFVSGVRGAGSRWGRPCNDNIGVPQ
jgi:hypothetical protein